MPTDAKTMAWMLESDPALRWQVERDLAGASPAVWEATRARVPFEGFGAELLSHQDPDGQWDGGAFFPKDFEGDENTPQPWTATTWSLNALRDWGVDAALLAGTAEQLAEHSRWEYDDLPYWGGEVDVCINAWTLMNGAWLGVDVAPLAQWFVDHQMDEGGWNCEWVEGSTRASFHSTLNASLGLLYYEQATGGSDAQREARHRGEEYLLQRHLLRKRSTGDQVAEFATEFGYPMRWRYNALRAVNHFRNVALHEGTAPDPRLADAIEVIRAKRQPDGTWLQDYYQQGKEWFRPDVAVGEPSKWLTFYGTRVLDWWDETHQR